MPFSTNAYLPDFEHTLLKKDTNQYDSMDTYKWMQNTRAFTIIMSNSVTDNTVLKSYHIIKTSIIMRTTIRRTKTTEPITIPAIAPGERPLSLSVGVGVVLGGTTKIISPTVKPAML